MWLALIAAVPAATAVASPPVDTLATAVLLELQYAPAVSFE
jgi:hypothetical protein